ncbi:Hypothetical predicted protein [Lynx pardinus]|uniref:Lipoxygenase domain-containing protein n=1 Tax=Lynx pardinus TaxID=191816 RepID=A0A485MMY4_LYNPA|nr:Hypothetical predicted protein [Lynx pardinus]
MGCRGIRQQAGSDEPPSLAQGRPRVRSSPWDRDLSSGRMGARRRVSTGSSLCAGSNNQVQLWLVGQPREAALKTGAGTGHGGDSPALSPSSRTRLGSLRPRLPEAESQADVQGPGASGDEFRFPCYRWVEGAGILRLPEGTGERGAGGGLFRQRREHELEERRKLYRWGSRKDGPILPVAGRTECDLPRNQRFLEDKDFDFRVSPAKAPAGGLGLEGSLDLTHPVKIAEDFKRASRRAGTPLAGQLPQSPQTWGSNSDGGDTGRGNLASGGALAVGKGRVSEGRGRKPVAHEIKAVRNRPQALDLSLLPTPQAGSLSEADFSLLDGVEPNVILRQQGVAAPLVMLTPQPTETLAHRRPASLSQTRISFRGSDAQAPRPHSLSWSATAPRMPPPPLFLPSGPRVAWLLAKTWVRGSHLQLSQLQSQPAAGTLDGRGDLCGHSEDPARPAPCLQAISASLLSTALRKHLCGV